MKPYYDDGQATVYQCDALTALQTLPDGLVQTCVTSPPYWGLRDYGADGQIGLEETPEAYVARLVDVFREVRRVLRDDGTCWINLGDSMLPNKCEAMIPHRVAMALMEDGWICRSTICWFKPNAMPESVIDRPTKAHEYIFLLSKRSSYYYDADAIREPMVKGDANAGAKNYRVVNGIAYRDDSTQGHENHPLGRNKRSVWSVSTIAYAGAHFATFPPKLIEPCILAGCPEGGIVLDPFAGSGTTLSVAKRLGRRSIGIELNEQYIAEHIIPRCQQQGMLLEVAS